MKNKLMAVLVICFILSLAVFADDSIKVTGVVGYDGKLVVNREMPLEINLENQGQDFKGELELILPMRHGSEKKVIIDVELAAGAKKTIKTTFQPITVKRIPIKYILKNQSSVIAEGEFESGTFYSDQQPAIALIGDKQKNNYYLNKANFQIAETLRDFAVQGHRETAEAAAGGATGTVIPLDNLSVFDNLELLSAFDVIYLSSVKDLAIDKNIADNLSYWLNGGGTLVLENAGDYKKVYNQLPASLQLKGLTDLEFKPLNLTVIKTMVNGESLDYARLDLSDKDRLLAIDGQDIGVLTLFGQGAIINFAPLTKDANYINQILAVSDSYRDFERKFRFNFYNINDYISYIEGIEFPYQTLAAILVLYTLIAGFVLYVILIKLKKRDYYWFAAPTLALATMLLMAVVARGSFGNQAVVNTFSTLTYNNNSASVEVNSLLAIFNNHTGDLKVSYPNDKNLLELNQRDDMYEEEILLSEKRLGKQTEIIDYMTPLWDKKFMLAKDVIPAENSYAEISILKEKDKELVEFKNQTPLHLQHAKLYLNGVFYELGEINSFNDYQYQLADLDYKMEMNYYHRSDYKDLSEDERNAMRLEMMVRETLNDYHSINQVSILGYNDDPIDYGVKVNDSVARNFDKNLVIFNLDMKYQSGTELTLNNTNLAISHYLGSKYDDEFYITGVIQSDEIPCLEIESDDWNGVLEQRFILPEGMKVESLSVNPELYLYNPKEEYVIYEQNLLGNLSVFSYEDNTYVELDWQDGMPLELDLSKCNGDQGIRIKAEIAPDLDYQQIYNDNSRIEAEEFYFITPLEIEGLGVME